MADDIKPWEKYAGGAQQASAPAGEAPPWEKYASAAQQQPQTAPAVAAPQAAPQAPSGPQPTFRQNLGRSIGLAARMGLQNATGTLSMAGDALNTAINMGGQAIGHNPHLGMPSQAIQQGINTVTPVPNTPGEKAADFIGSMLAGSIGKGVDPLARMMTRNITPPPSKVATTYQQTIMDAQKAGYKVSPSQSEGGILGTALEKFAGSKRLTGSIQQKNQTLADTLMRKAAGLSPTDELTHDALNQAINSTYQSSYEPLKAAGRMTTGGNYRRALDKVLTEHQGASPDFPDAVDQKVLDLVNAYRRPGFDSGNAVAAIRNLRKNATAAYATEPNLAGANRGIANALEDNIDLNLSRRNPPQPELLDNYRTGRTQIAKQIAVSDAIREGSGHVDALKLAAKVQKHPGLLTDELGTLGKLANVAPSMASMPSAQGSAAGGLMGFLQNIAPTGGALLLNHPLIAAALASVPAARYGLRAGMLSPMGQKMIGPHLDPGILARLGRDPRMLNAIPTAMTQSGLYNYGEQQ